MGVYTKKGKATKLTASCHGLHQFLWKSCARPNGLMEFHKFPRRSWLFYVTVLR